MSDENSKQGPHASAISHDGQSPEQTPSAHDSSQRSNTAQSPAQSDPSTPHSSQFINRSSRDNFRTSDTMLSRAAGSIRRASTLILDDAPTGLMAVAGNAAGTAPSIGEIRRGSFGDGGWSAHQQARGSSKRSSDASRAQRLSDLDQIGTMKRRSSEMEPVIKESEDAQQNLAIDHLPTITASNTTKRSMDNNSPSTLPDDADLPKLPWTTSWWIGTKAVTKWVLTIKGFLITVYMLNVIAWGGMLFLLLCNAAPAMCSHTKDGCNDFNSPRRKWMEIDQQILNAFFCLTGFGLAPWRFRDTWYLLIWRGFVTRDLKKREIALRKLAGIHRSWFRLRGSEDWKNDEPLRSEEHYNSDPTVPLPIKRRLAPPITGVRAPPTAYWKMDFLVWNNVWNTIFQAFLAAFMWAYNRAKRPPWTTALFISLAFGVAIAAGVLTFKESSRVKKVEGVLPNPEKIAAQRALREKDLERGEKAPVGFAAALRTSNDKTPHEAVGPVSQV